MGCDPEAEDEISLPKSQTCFGESVLSETRKQTKTELDPRFTSDPAGLNGTLLSFRIGW